MFRSYCQPMKDDFIYRMKDKINRNATEIKLFSFFFFINHSKSIHLYFCHPLKLSKHLWFHRVMLDAFFLQKSSIIIQKIENLWKNVTPFNIRPSLLIYHTQIIMKFLWYTQNKTSGVYIQKLLGKGESTICKYDI